MAIQKLLIDGFSAPDGTPNADLLIEIKPANGTDNQERFNMIVTDGGANPNTVLGFSVKVADLLKAIETITNQGGL